MSTSPTALPDAADLLYRAQRSAIPIPPLTSGYPDLTVGQAYSVQRMNLARYMDAGAVVRGHKIGLTSTPMQELLGVDEPDFGYILDAMMLANDAATSVSAFCAPRVEPEVAFLMRAPLRGPDVTAEHVMAATEAVAPAVEIVDSRIVDWRIRLADTIADNASSGAVVLGEWVSIDEAPSLPDSAATLVVNGTTVGVGRGSAVMGHPATAVAWLANALAAFDTQIEAGQFVMSGSYTTAAFVAAGDEVCASITGLGDARISFI